MVLVLISKPTLLLPFIPNWTFAMLLAYMYRFPLHNISLELLIIGIVLDLLYGNPIGLHSLVYLLLYGIMSRFLLQLSKLGRLIQIISILCVILAERLIIILIYPFFLLPLPPLQRLEIYIPMTFFATILFEYLIIKFILSTTTHARYSGTLR
ncbi:MAG: hypothetical protein QM538_03915 [Methylacidiphilales bacterium]|nr:hypothetical protein [Candidatus Methylacidiphilales bacterium]